MEAYQTNTLTSCLANFGSEITYFVGVYFTLSTLSLTSKW